MHYTQTKEWQDKSYEERIEHLREEYKHALAEKRHNIQVRANLLKQAIKHRDKNKKRAANTQKTTALAVKLSDDELKELFT